MKTAALLACLSVVLLASSAGAVNPTITVVNLDGAGEGFNDPTAVVPAGGNPATTLGEARLNAFEHAAAIWAAHLSSSVEIRVDAKMDPLACTDGVSAILGSAGAVTV